MLFTPATTSAEARGGLGCVHSLPQKIRITCTSVITSPGFIPAARVWPAVASPAE
jgi:hypothetical protein